MDGEDMIEAIQNHNLDIVKYIVSLGYNPVVDDIEIAVRGNDLDIVKYLVEISEASLSNIAKVLDEPEIVKYLLSIGVRPTYEDIFDAAAKGHLELLKDLIEASK